MEEAESSFDLITVILVLALFLPIAIPIMTPLLKGDIGGFDVQLEKTAPVTRGVLNPKDETEVKDFDSGDALLTLLVADENVPQPRRVRMDTGGTQVEIALDDAFFANRKQRLDAAWAAMLPNSSVDMRLYAGPSGMRFWNFKFTP